MCPDLTLVGGTRNNDARVTSHTGMLGEYTDKGKGRIGIMSPDFNVPSYEPYWYARRIY